MRITVKEAAEIMQCTPQMIRIGLQRGLFPFGTAIQMSRRYTYYISREKVYQYLGGVKDGNRDFETRADD